MKILKSALVVVLLMATMLSLVSCFGFYKRPAQLKASLIEKYGSDISIEKGTGSVMYNIDEEDFTEFLLIRHDSAGWGMIFYCDSSADAKKVYNDAKYYPDSLIKKQIGNNVYIGTETLYEMIKSA